MTILTNCYKPSANEVIRAYMKHHLKRTATEGPIGRMMDGSAWQDRSPPPDDEYELLCYFTADITRDQWDMLWLMHYGHNGGQHGEMVVSRSSDSSSNIVINHQTTKALRIPDIAHRLKLPVEVVRLGIWAAVQSVDDRLQKKLLTRCM